MLEMRLKRIDYPMVGSFFGETSVDASFFENEFHAFVS